MIHSAFKVCRWTPNVVQDFSASGGGFGLEDACLNWLFFTRNVCAAFAATIEVMMATTVAMRMTPGREDFWIRIVIAFVLFGFLLC
jgi:hypothetical protein